MKFVEVVELYQREKEGIFEWKNLWAWYKQIKSIRDLYRGV